MSGLPAPRFSPFGGAVCVDLLPRGCVVHYSDGEAFYVDGDLFSEPRPWPLRDEVPGDD